MNGAHQATGLAAGAAVTAIADILGVIEVHPVAYIGYMLVAGGFALFCDIDSDGSVFTRSGGYVTRGLAEVLQATSRVTYRATRKPCDRGTGEHRFLIHSWPFAILVGVAIGAGAETWPVFGSFTLPAIDPYHQPITIPLPGFGWCVMVMAVSPAIRSLAMDLHHNHGVNIRRANPRKWGKEIAAISRFGSKTMDRARTRRWSFGYSLAIGVLLWILWIFAGSDLFGWWLGVIATTGMLTHNSGDSITRHGIPWKWPFAHRCDKHRAAYLNAACSAWKVRIPWHHCTNCDTARRRYPRCARWDRNTVIPERWTFTAGDQDKETTISMVCLIASACTLVVGILG